MAVRYSGAEGLGDLRETLAAGRLQVAHDLVGTHDRGAEFAQEVRRRGSCRVPMPPVSPITRLRTVLMGLQYTSLGGPIPEVSGTR